jgi:hypothetical protein
VPRHGAQQCSHLFELEIVGVGERCSLDWNRRDLLAHCEHIRDTNGEVGKERVQRRASLVAGAWRITSFVLEMLEEAEY